MSAIRNMSPAERIRRWEEFNEALAEMELAAHQRRYPHLSERQRFLIRMRLKYGSELSARIWPEASNAVT